MIKNLHLLQQLKKELHSNQKPAANKKDFKGSKAPKKSTSSDKKAPQGSLVKRASQPSSSASPAQPKENSHKAHPQTRFVRNNKFHSEEQQGHSPRYRTSSKELTLSNQRTIIYSNGVLNPQQGQALVDKSSNTSDSDYQEILNLTAPYCEGYNCTCFYDEDKKISHPILNGILKIHPKGFGFVETKKQNYFIAPHECQKALNNAEVGIVEFVTDRGFGANIKRINPNPWEKTLVCVKQVQPLKVCIEGDSLEQSFSLDLSALATAPQSLALGQWFLAHPLDVEAKLKNQGEIVFVADQYLGHNDDPNLMWLKNQALRNIPPSYPAQASELSNTDKGERIDLSAIPFFSIDNASTQDIDDLIYFSELDPDLLAQTPTVELSPLEAKYFTCEEELAPQKALYQEEEVLRQLEVELEQARQKFSNSLANSQQKASYYRERHEQQLAQGLINPLSGEAHPPEVINPLLNNKKGTVKIFSREEVEQAEQELSSLANLSNPEEELLSNKIALQKAKLEALSQESFTYPALKAYPFPEFLQPAQLKVPAQSRYLLSVAIADPSHFFAEDSEINKAAFKLGQSHFLPAKTIYMIDRNISIEHFSLQEGKKLPALVSFIYFDAEFKLLATEVRISTIKNHAKLDYDYISAYLEACGYQLPKEQEAKELQQEQQLAESSAVKPLEEFEPQEFIFKGTIEQGQLRTMLQALAQFYLGRHEYRVKHKKPMLNSLNNSEYTIVDGKCVDIKTITMGIANDLISECMLSNNTALSRFCFAKGIKALYSQQSGFSAREILNTYNYLEYLRDYEGLELDDYLHKDKESLLQLSFADFTKLYRHIAQKNLRLSEFLNRFMATSSFAYQAKPHAGIGEELYSSFTSPIRKYLDLHNQRNLKAYLWNSPQSQLSEAELSAVKEMRSQMRILNRELVNEYSEQYLNLHREDDFILEVNYCFATGLAVIDSKTNIRGFIHHNKLGQHKDSFKYLCNYAVTIDGKILKVGDKIQGKLLRSSQGKNLFRVEKLLTH